MDDARRALLDALLVERYTRPTAPPAPLQPRRAVVPLIALDDPDVIAERRRVLEQIDHNERTA